MCRLVNSNSFVLFEIMCTCAKIVSLYLSSMSLNPYMYINFVVLFEVARADAYERPNEIYSFLYSRIRRGILETVRATDSYKML